MFRVAVVVDRWAKSGMDEKKLKEMGAHACMAAWDQEGKRGEEKKRGANCI